MTENKTDVSKMLPLTDCATTVLSTTVIWSLKTEEQPKLKKPSMKLLKKFNKQNLKRW